jgi:hypothetical protein
MLYITTIKGGALAEAEEIALANAGGFLQRAGGVYSRILYPTGARTLVLDSENIIGGFMKT